MFNKVLLLFFASTLMLCLFSIAKHPVYAEINLAKKLSGKILLQVENLGEAWYVNPIDAKKYYLGRPTDAFELMKKLSLGITDADMRRVPINLDNVSGHDSDGDGLPDDLETAMGTNSLKSDSDDDGFDDRTEIINGYDPSCTGKLPIDPLFAGKLSGRILLQAQNKGQAWYINPAENKAYFLNKPMDAFSIMRSSGLGIKNSDLAQIPTGSLYITEPAPIESDLAKSTLISAAKAIAAKNKESAVKYFIPEMKKSIEYTIDHMRQESLDSLATLLSNSTLEKAGETEKTYFADAYFSLGSQNITFEFTVKKQPDNTWKITNL